jgi:Nucleotidyl transferase AbiEii toxin, Type IV TA system
VVEKDHVLGWLLAGIYSRAEFTENWVFKGGTCLKKCFFETDRFSEDLDVTLREPPREFRLRQLPAVKTVVPLVPETVTLPLTLMTRTKDPALPAPSSVLAPGHFGGSPAPEPARQRFGDP